MKLWGDGFLFIPYFIVQHNRMHNFQKDTVEPNMPQMTT